MNVYFYSCQLAITANTKGLKLTLNFVLANSLTPKLILD